MNKLMCFLCFVPISAIVAAAEPTPKLALCASGDKRAGEIVELVGVPLSRDDKVVLLDRAEIAKVLAEQKLAFTGMLSTDDALKAGQLLHCDVFAELNCRMGSPNEPGSISIVMCDALTGVRLCDQAVSSNVKSDEQVVRVQRVLEDGLDKWRSCASGAPMRTVSLIGVRGLDLAPATARIPNLIGMMLERELLRSPGVTVLERKRLALVNSERSLTDIARDRLLASAIRLDIDVLRFKNDTNVEARVSLSDIAGKSLGVVRQTGSAGDIAAMIDALTAGILAQLKVAPVQFSATACRDEAARLLADKRLYESRGQKAEAAIAEEAARALAESAMQQDPGDLQAQQFVSTFNRRRAEAASDPSEMLDILEQDLRLCEKWPAIYAAPLVGVDSPFDTRVSVHWFNQLLIELLKKSDAMYGGKNEKQPRIVKLRERYGAWIREMGKAHWENICYFNVLEHGSHNVSEALRDSRELMTFMPPGLNIAYVNCEHHDCGEHLFYPIDSYSREDRRLLFDLYQKWGCLGETYYRVEKIVYDPARKRLFINAVFRRTSTGWLFALDLGSGQIQRVCKVHNFMKQLRPAGPERYFVRIHSNSSNGPDGPQYWGYGIWFSIVFQGTPVDAMENHMDPLVGSLHKDLLNWTGGKPHFNGSGHVVPSSTDALDLLDSQHLVASDGATWQLIERSDAGGRYQVLPQLENLTPFRVQVVDGDIWGCTAEGLWRVRADGFVAEADVSAPAQRRVSPK